jgi:hypothetical protein
MFVLSCINFHGSTFAWAMASERLIERAQGSSLPNGIRGTEDQDRPTYNASLAERQYTVHKRHRTSRACLNCRRLRIKCGGQKPCQACIDSSMACNYGGEASSSRATRLTLASAAKRIEELERQLAVQQSQEPAPRRADVARSKSSPLSAPILHHAQAEESSAVHEMLYGVDRMPNATGHPEYFGSSSPTATRYLLERLAILPRDGQETQKMASRDRVSIWHSDRRQLRFSTTAHPGSSWLPRRLADKYIRCYFRTVHRVCPALEQVHFMERYERFWQNLPTEGRGYTRWTAVLYGVGSWSPVVPCSPAVA